MPIFDSPLLAQANAAAEKISAGQAVSALLVLFTMACSVAMIAVWVVRLGQHGNAIPAARRGILRVPPMLTVFAVGLSLLLLLLTRLVPSDEASGVPRDGAPASESASGTGSANPETPVSADSVVVEPETKVLPGGREDIPAPAMSPTDMQHNLIAMIVLDLILLAVFGIFVLASSAYGRVAVSESGHVIPAHEAEFGMLPTATMLHRGNSLSGEHLPFERSGLAAPDSPFDPPRADAGELHSLEAMNAELNLSLPEEPYSWLTEMRFAGEAFLAAYVPTTFLRVVVVMMTERLFGEPPDQHPLLQMLDTGVGIQIVGLIAFTAVVMAPIVEELQYRVVILGGLARLGSPALALGCSSLLFALAHGFPDALALLPLAAVLGYTYLRRRSYITVMLVHFLFNFFNMAIALIALF